jgi:hypothetical protein
MDLEFNVNDYDFHEFDERSLVEVERKSFDRLSRYTPDSTVSLKSRPDVVGRIKRIEDDNLVVTIFEETYSIPPENFEQLFFVREENSPENWYTRIAHAKRTNSRRQKNS